VGPLVADVVRREVALRLGDFRWGELSS